MKTYRQFCEDANLNEFNLGQVKDLAKSGVSQVKSLAKGAIKALPTKYQAPATNIAKTAYSGAKSAASAAVKGVKAATAAPAASAAPKTGKVLAYKNYKPGVLDKGTGKFTQRAHTDAEAKRYGWKPVKASSYGPADTTSQSYNTGGDGVQRTADGTAFTGKTRAVAVPYKYKKGEVPKGTSAGTPSTPFGTKLSLTTKPMGKNTKAVTSTVRDTGNFGKAGEVNKETDMDLTRQTARDLTGDDKDVTPTQWGKRMIYKETR